MGESDKVTREKSREQEVEQEVEQVSGHMSATTEKGSHGSSSIPRHVCKSRRIMFECAWQRRHLYLHAPDADVKS